MRRVPICALLMAAVTVSCMAAPEQPPDKRDSVTATPPREPEPILDPQNSRPVTGEVPADTLERLRAEVAAQAQVDVKDVKVMTAELVQWPNGALGCPQPGRMYTQALVPGYRVVLQAGGKRYHYHAALKGPFTLCPNPAPAPANSAQ